MTAARPGVGHGRGGQGGHEPRAQVQAREQRVLERSVAGLSQREIAAEEGITQSAVSKILQRVEARVFKEFVARVEQQKGRQDMSLRFIFQEGMKAWEASKTDATRRVQKKTQPAAGASSTTVAQLVVENRHGDSRYLEIARKALADQRRVWGLDAPHKVDVRASAGAEGDQGPAVAAQPALPASDPGPYPGSSTACGTRIGAFIARGCSRTNLSTSGTTAIGPRRRSSSDAG